MTGDESAISGSDSIRADGGETRDVSVGGTDRSDRPFSEGDVILLDDVRVEITKTDASDVYFIHSRCEYEGKMKRDEFRRVVDDALTAEVKPAPSSTETAQDGGRDE